MKIRRFYAENSREALRQVRETLGPDAVILSNRQVDGGVEIITAVDFEEDAFLNPETEDRPAVAKPGRQDRRAPAAPAANQNDPSFMQQLKHAVSARHQGDTPKGGAPAPASLSETPAKPTPRVGIAAYGQVSQAAEEDNETKATIAALKSELKEMRSLMEKRLPREDKDGAEAPVAQPAARAHGTLMPLIQLGFNTRMARQILSAQPESRQGDDIKDILKRYLAEQLPVAADNFEQGGVFALLGPTGVGKTTTLAKLAARFSLRYGTQQVALLTTDTYRIAGSEQLRVYGRILGIPVEVVPDALTLQERLDALAHKKFILIDSVGFSPKDERIQQQFQTLANTRQRIQRLLVMNAAAGRAHQQLVLKTYGAQGLDACIISKVDEAPKLGEAVDMLLQHRMPLTFYTNGQRVPEDMHRLDVDALMDLLFQKTPMVEGLDAEMETQDAWGAGGQPVRQAGYSF